MRRPCAASIRWCARSSCSCVGVVVDLSAWAPLFLSAALGFRSPGRERAGVLAVVVAPGPGRLTDGDELCVNEVNLFLRVLFPAAGWPEVSLPAAPTAPSMMGRWPPRLPSTTRKGLSKVHADRPTCQLWSITLRLNFVVRLDEVLCRWLRFDRRMPLLRRWPFSSHERTRGSAVRPARPNSTPSRYREPRLHLDARHRRGPVASVTMF